MSKFNQATNDMDDANDDSKQHLKLSNKVAKEIDKYIKKSKHLRILQDQRRLFDLSLSGLHTAGQTQSPEVINGFREGAVGALGGTKAFQESVKNLIQENLSSSIKMSAKQLVDFLEEYCDEYRGITDLADNLIDLAPEQ